MEMVIGLDIGQKRDPTAVCVAEAHGRRAGEERQEVHFVVRYLERLPLGTPYPTVTERASEVFTKLKARSGSTPRFYVDATGVGKPIVDMLEEKGIRGVACYFNHGDRRNEKSWREVIIGKAFLVSRLQLLLQTGRLHLPRTPGAQSLSQELLDFQHVMEPKDNERQGAFKVGTRDELVTAIGLATQVDQPTASSVWDLADAWGPVDDLLK